MLPEPVLQQLPHIRLDLLLRIIDKSSEGVQDTGIFGLTQEIRQPSGQLFEDAPPLLSAQVLPSLGVGNTEVRENCPHYAVDVCHSTSLLWGRMRARGASASGAGVVSAPSAPPCGC